jgi:hypothetical protein
LGGKECADRFNQRIWHVNYEIALGCQLPQQPDRRSLSLAAAL